ncbi:MAG: hypothetical protein IT176_01420 [Acidobacteria bacterium]|nr:hypothetical protein [Acidobacteriota bacterium]
MRPAPIVRAAMVAAVMLAASNAAFAQVPDASPQELRDAIDQLRRELDARLSALEARLAAVEGEPSPGAAPAPSAAAVPGAKVFNPDIAVIGNFLGAAGRNDVDPAPPLELREAEASLQAIVDPYARADFFLAFGGEGVEIEEGVLTLTALPAGLLGKVGRMKAAFGKVNTLHTHMLPWADRPLVIDNLVGGEEGIADAGLSVAKLLPNPWFFLEATGQVFRGDAGDGLFASSRRRDLLYVGHLRGYRDLSDSANVDLGVSFAQGHNPAGVVDDADVGRFETRLYGIDATVRWRPLARAIYRSFLGRSEIVWSRRGQFGGEQRAAGFYVSGDYQFARRWFAGVRAGRSARASDAARRDQEAAGTVTFWPSEFSQVRGEYRRIGWADAPASHEVLVQFLFAIGAHGAHPF